MRKFPMTILPGVESEIRVFGRYIRVKTSPVTLSVKLFGQDYEGDSYEVDLDAGEELQAEKPFKVIRLSHDDVAAQNVVVYVSKDVRMGSSKVGGSVALSGAIDLSAATLAALENTGVTVSGPVSLGQGAATQGRATVTNANQQIIPANAARRWLLVQNNDAAAVLRLTVDGSVASATNGFRIQAGDSMEIVDWQPTGAINVFTETAGSGAGNVEFAWG